MPEHVHMLVNEPERETLAKAMQSLKQSVARTLALRAAFSIRDGPRATDENPRPSQAWTGHPRNGLSCARLGHGYLISRNRRGGTRSIYGVGDLGDAPTRYSLHCRQNENAPSFSQT